MTRRSTICIWMLVTAVQCALAADRSSAILSVEFAPEVLMTQSGGVVNLKIRLSDRGSARIWIADSCTVSGKQGDAPASYVVNQSGEYEIPLSSVPGRGSRICLTSTDRLTDEAPSGQPPA